MECEEFEAYGKHNFDMETSTMSYSNVFQIVYSCTGQSCTATVTRRFEAEKGFEFENGDEECPEREEHDWDDDIVGSVTQDSEDYVTLREGCRFCDAVRKREFSFLEQKSN